MQPRALLPFFFLYVYGRLDSINFLLHGTAVNAAQTLSSRAARAGVTRGAVNFPRDIFATVGLYIHSFPPPLLSKKSLSTSKSCAFQTSAVARGIKLYGVRIKRRIKRKTATASVSRMQCVLGALQERTRAPALVEEIR